MMKLMTASCLHAQQWTVGGSGDACPADCGGHRAPDPRG